MTDIINEEENSNQIPEEIEDVAVVDNGTTYESTESAIIAKEEADRAKLWAQESERQANLASGSADTAAQARDDAVAAKEYAEAAVTDANVVAVGTDLRSTPSNIKTVASNITDVTTVAGVSSAVTTVAGVSSAVTTVAGISSAVTTVASNATNVSTVAGVSSDVTIVAGISSDVTSVAGNATDISAVAANNTNITAVAGNATNINAVNANKTNIDKVAGDINRVNLVADDIASVHTVAVDISTVIDVANNKTNIDAVAGNNANITAVAGNSTNINAVNANKTNIDAVAANNTNITAVAGDLTNINAVAADLTNIDNASANAQLAKDWAIKMDGMVASEDYSAKYYADQARQAAAGAVTDGKSINRNTSDELQTIGVINQNDTSTAIKTWTGTQAQYDALKVAHTMYEWEEDEFGGMFVYTEALRPNVNDPVYDSSYNVIGRVTNREDLGRNTFIYLDDNVVYFRPTADDSTTTIYENRIDANTLYNITDDTDISLTILEALYPVGSIYITTNAACPLQTLGVGTWELVGQDKVLQGAGLRGAVGTTLSAGLPNIIATVRGTNRTDTGETTNGFKDFSGSFYATETIAHNVCATATGNYQTNGLGFNAALSNPIYGNSATVQPDAYLVNIFRRIS